MGGKPRAKAPPRAMAAGMSFRCDACRVVLPPMTEVLCNGCDGVFCEGHALLHQQCRWTDGVHE